MTLRILILLACISIPGFAQEPACTHLESEHILGKDLARAIHEFGSLPGEAVLGAAPLAGGKRVFYHDEIASLAARYAIRIASSPDVCFDWAMEKLDRASLLEAMRASLGIPAARIEIAEMFLERAPQGLIEFPREGLGKPASVTRPTPVLWRGTVTYAGTRRFAIWARVRITVPVNIITATEMLKVGEPIRPGQLKIDSVDRFPDATGSAPGLEQLVGLMPQRSLSPGSEVRLENLVRPNDVSRGDLVAIEVRSGRTRLLFSGRAESAGRTGDMIAVRNPESNRIFRARVCAKDKVIVEPDINRGN